MDGRLALAAPLALVLACGTSSLQNVRSDIGAERLPRPDVVLVYDFAFEAGDVYADQKGVGGGSGSPQERRQLGAQVADALAASLVEKLRAAGIPARRASVRSQVPLHAASIKGRLERIDEGDAALRTTIGLGQGAARLAIHAEGYQQTSYGPRRIGEGQLLTSSGRRPGVVGPGVASAATGKVAGVAAGATLAAHGELGSAIQAEVDRAATTLAERVVERFRQQGWMEAGR